MGTIIFSLQALKKLFYLREAALAPCNVFFAGAVDTWKVSTKTHLSKSIQATPVQDCNLFRTTYMVIQIMAAKWLVTSYPPHRGLEVQ